MKIIARYLAERKIDRLEQIVYYREIKRQIREIEDLYKHPHTQKPNKLYQYLMTL